MKRLIALASIALIAACTSIGTRTPQPRVTAMSSNPADTTIVVQNCAPMAVDWADATHTLLVIGCPTGSAPPQPPQCPAPPGAGPCTTPPPTGTIACTGFTATRVIDIPFANSARVFTKDFGGFGPNDAVVLRFTTSTGPSITNNLPRVIGAEWLDPLYVRTAVLSDKPCDWAAQQYAAATLLGTSIQVPFTVNNANNGGFYPILKSNTTYYWNIKTNPDSGCTTTCNMFLDMYRSNTP